MPKSFTKVFPRTAKREKLTSKTVLELLTFTQNRITIINIGAGAKLWILTTSRLQNLNLHIWQSVLPCSFLFLLLQYLTFPLTSSIIPTNCHYNQLPSLKQLGVDLDDIFVRCKPRKFTPRMGLNKLLPCCTGPYYTFNKTMIYRVLIYQ